MNVAKAWLSSWGEEHSSKVDVVICFGSSGRGNPLASSDLDICVIGKDLKPNELLNDLKQSFKVSLGYVKADQHKIVVFLQLAGGSIFRIDGFVVDDIDKVKTYIVGSELSVSNMDKIVLYANPHSGDVCMSQLRHMIETEVPYSDLAELLQQLIMSFIESFEVASNKRASGDKFQFLFQMNLGYTYLVKLEYIRHGGRQFLYLPKMAFNSFDEGSQFCAESGLSTRRNFEDILEPRGKLNNGHTQQEAYVSQFRNTVTALTTLHPGLLDGIAESVDSICDALSLVLLRDRFYNFRDAAKGGMKTGHR